MHKVINNYHQKQYRNPADTLRDVWKELREEMEKRREAVNNWTRKPGCFDSTRYEINGIPLGRTKQWSHLLFIIVNVSKNAKATIGCNIG